MSMVSINGVQGRGLQQFRKVANNQLTEILAEDLFGITTIGYAAFRNKTNLATVVIPDSVTMVYGDTFVSCSKLKTVEMGINVKSIPTYCFNGCSQLVSVTLKSDTLVSLASTNAFGGANANYIVYVPSALLSSYQTATNWVDIASHLQAIPS